MRFYSQTLFAFSGRNNMTLRDCCFYPTQSAFLFFFIGQVWLALKAFFFYIIDTTCTPGCTWGSIRLIEKPAWRCGFPPSGCILQENWKQALSIFIIRHQVLCQVQPSCSAALHHPRSLLTLIDSLKSTILVLQRRQTGREGGRRGRLRERKIEILYRYSRNTEDLLSNPRKN